MEILQLGDDVALQGAETALTPLDEEIQLARGQVGKIIEARDPDGAVIVEFATPAGEVYALASVARTSLLKLRHDPPPSVV